MSPTDHQMHGPRALRHRNALADALASGTVGSADAFWHRPIGPVLSPGRARPGQSPSGPGGGSTSRLRAYQRAASYAGAAARPSKSTQARSGIANRLSWPVLKRPPAQASIRGSPLVITQDP